MPVRRAGRSASLEQSRGVVTVRVITEIGSDLLLLVRAHVLDHLLVLDDLLLQKLDLLL